MVGIPNKGNFIGMIELCNAHDELNTQRTNNNFFSNISREAIGKMYTAINGKFH